MTAPRLLITGGMGYIARHVLAQAQGWDLHATWFRTPPPDPPAAPAATFNLQPSTFNPVWHRLNITDCDAVYDLLTRVQPTVVLHTAYQMNTPIMRRVIVDGTRHVAAAAAFAAARLIYLSTDVIFDGRRGHYRETDEPNPLHAYGSCKKAAERFARMMAPGGVIVRTSLVYGFAPPDPRTQQVWDAARGQADLTLFSDELRCPVYAPDLAAALLELAAGDFAGALHVAGPETLSRYDFGVLLCRAQGIDPRLLKSALAATSGLTRPLDCSLDTSLAQQVLRTRLRGASEVCLAPR